MRRFAIAAVSLTIAAAGVAVAEPASAAAYDTALTCSSGVSGTPSLSRSALSVTPGDVVAVTGPGALTTFIVTAASGGISPSASGTFGTSQSFTIGAGFSGASIVLNRCGSITLTLTLGGGGADGGDASASDSSTPAPIIQQFGKPESGTCVDAAPASLNWAGVSSGGWGESWAEWVNGGRGGAVCTRTLTYSNSVGAWMAS